MFDQVVRFFHEVDVALLQLVEAMPPGVVRGHHGRAHAGPAPFVVPQFIELEVERLPKEGLGVHQFFGVKLIQLLLGGLEVDIIIGLDHVVQLDIMIVNPGVAVALEADFFHLLALRLPVGLRRKGLEILRADGQRCLEFPGEPLGDVVGGQHLARAGHVADRAGGAPVVHPRGPGAGRGVPVVF